jgi:hypothetical protein
LEFTQTAFIPGRNIHDGVVVLHEILHDLHRTNGSGLIIKLDFEKAYDKVHWNFLEEVLARRKFYSTWIGWIKQVVQSGRVCININEVNGSYFRTYKGLRQGDPLSPILFNQVVEALGSLLN